MVSLAKLRAPLGILAGFTIVIFGVFMFSAFKYRGLTLEYHIFPLLAQLNTFSDGVYQLISSPFTVSLFAELSPENIAQSSFSAILFGESVWPIIATWFAGGLTTGFIVKGAKRGLLSGAILFLLITVLWIIFGFFAGADLGTMFLSNIELTLGEIVTGIIFLLPTAFFGGIISGP